MGDGPVIAIVGGGIGGLAVALALHQRGFRCDVYEQTPSLTDVGGGLNLSPNALKTFRMLDVEEEVIAAGFQDETQTVRNGETAAILAQQSRRDGVMDKYGAGFLTVHRADVQNILRARIPPERLHLGKSCVRLENMPETVRLTFADGSSVEADMAIGADGIHSAVRESLFGKQPPQFTGCMCFRGLVPVEEADNISGARDMTAWWGPHGHVIHYRVRGGSMINFVAHFDSDAWAEESWTRECTKEEVLATFADWHPDILKLIALGEKHYKWALYDRDPLPRWTAGRVTLLGDSAHPMLPYLGQGAAMALEDACLLARMMETGSADIPTLLQRYESVRRPRTTAVQLASRARARQYHLASPLARMWRDVKIALRRRFGKDKSTLHADWIYRYDVAAAPLDKPTGFENAA